MSNIIDYITNVTEETSTQVNVEQESLKKSLILDDYKEVNETLQQNSTTRKKALQQNRQKNSIISNTFSQHPHDKQIPLHKREHQPKQDNQPTLAID